MVRLGAGVDFVFRLVALLSSLALISVCVRGRTLEKKMTSLSSPVSGMGILYPHVSKHPSFVSGLCPLPASTLSVSRLSAGQAALPSRVVSPMGLCLRTPGFRDFPGLDTRQLSGSNGQVTTCPRKQLCASTPSKVQITARSWGQVSPHSGVFVSIPANEAALLGLWGLFPWGGRMASTRFSPRREIASPHVARGPRRPRCLLLGDSPYFVTRAPPGTEL